MSAPCPKCAELAAAIAELQVLYREDEQCMVEDGHSMRVDDTDYAAIGKEALAAHDAAKDAEIQRLRGALETIDALVSSDPDMSGNPRWHFRSARGQQVADAIAKLKAALEVQP